MHENSAQQKAALHLTGPLLLIAGPGSGKTTVITKRIQNLITLHGISPHRILVITFTRAAAMEMKTRSSQICLQAGGAAFGTFHSVFYHILRQNPRFREFSLLDTMEKEKILQGLLLLHGIQKEELWIAMEEVERLLTLVKNSGMDIDFLHTMQAEQLWRAAQICNADAEKRERYCRILASYREECVLQKKLDFDDMLVYCKEILTEDPVFRRQWQERFSYILVDEFQDINRAQFEVLRLLSKEPYNIFAVGDDDQSIYGFRGSDPSFMKCFQEVFPGCITMQLTNNYRSSREIVDAAGACISHNQNRFPKEIMAVSREKGEFSIKRFTDRKQEDEWLAEACKEAVMYSVAILVRTNQAVAYYEALLSRVDFSGPDDAKRGERDGEKNGGMDGTGDVTKEAWHEGVAGDILAILQFALGKRDREQFFRFMNKPQRGISRIAVSEQVSFAQLRQTYGHSRQMVQKITKLEQELLFLADLPPFGAVQYIFSVMGYEKYVQTCDCQRVKERICMMRTMDELKEHARAYESLPDYVQWLQTCECTDAGRNGIGKGENGRKNGRNNGRYNDRSRRREGERGSEGGGIQIMTYHGAKGLEFDTVFLPDVRDGVVPRGRMLTQEELEEERRMFYVAMTRAKRNLYISYSGDIQADDRKSVFIRELEENDEKTTRETKPQNI